MPAATIKTIEEYVIAAVDLYSLRTVILILRRRKAKYSEAQWRANLYIIVPTVYTCPYVLSRQSQK